jgi:hypothetical protein
MVADVEGDPDIVAIVRSHHERLDGRGYPDGLAGDDIPLGARIIAVADTFDALTSTRSYRPAARHKRALDILRKEAGAQLDGAAVAAFLRTYSGRRPAAVSSLVVLAPQRAMAWAGHQVSAGASLAPAAGWIAPAAAAAAAVLGVAHGTDHAASHPAGHATQTAAVRAALPARTARLVAIAPVSASSDRPKAPAKPKARRPTPKRHDGAPKAPTTTTATQGPTATEAPTAATAADSTPSAAHAGSPPDSPLPDVSASAKLPPVSLPAVEPVVASVTQTVAALPQTVAAVTGAVSTVDAGVAGVVPTVTGLLPPK